MRQILNIIIAMKKQIESKNDSNDFNDENVISTFTNVDARTHTHKKLFRFRSICNSQKNPSKMIIDIFAMSSFLL